MENSENKRRKNRIQLCADEFRGDAWAEYCAICNAPSGASSITIWFDDGDIEYDCDDEEENEAASDRHTGLTVKATVTFQRWEGDVARFNGEAEFDACDALDSMDDEQLAQVERNDPWALDSVYMRAVMFGQIHDYDGPFEVDLDEDNFSDYLEARRNGR